MKPILYRIMLLLLVALCSTSMYAQSANEPAVIENYYKVKWGYAAEFIELWKKNHYPFLKKAQEKGDVLTVVAVKPSLHAGEETRWDFKVTIRFKNLQAAFDPNLTAPYKKALYPDLEKLDKDEQHRFSLLLAHWDVLVEEIKL
ncbi:hypothetical protein [Paraflavitalea sp. CAU 1676]|uniref:hypothetical protein n=1 Tax=Paraflavitalea sp. CAU 1676 TaxID=3032598 RepID=UPI0023DAA44B|nr:hypothetical protein [Paraflavitalea sp. CAU 1676]MDF2193170.1 hypothetical protein [Paraflavitalea sp. CAU 1676]